MSLQLIQPPAGEAVPLAEIKAHLRIETADEDGLIALYARAATRAVEARGGLALIAQGWRLAADRPPAGRFRLPRGPLLSVDAVTIRPPGAASGAAETLPPDLYEVETGARGAIRFAAHAPRAGALAIDFTAGWPDAAAVPEELRLAVKMLAAHFHENREGAAAERVFAVPQAVDALIAPWREIRL